MTALTRNAASKPAQALAALGVEVVQGDMGEAASLRPIFAGAYGVYSVQNPFISGPEAEVRQGKTIADVAKAGENTLSPDRAYLHEQSRSSAPGGTHAPDGSAG